MDNPHESLPPEGGSATPANQTNMTIGELLDSIGLILDGLKGVEINFNLNTPSTNETEHAAGPPLDLNVLPVNTLFLRRNDDGESFVSLIPDDGVPSPQIDLIEADEFLRPLLNVNSSDALTAGVMTMRTDTTRTEAYVTWIPDGDSASPTALVISLASLGSGTVGEFSQCMQRNSALPFKTRVIKCVSERAN